MVVYITGHDILIMKPFKTISKIKNKTRHLYGSLCFGMLVYEYVIIFGIIPGTWYVGIINEGVLDFLVRDTREANWLEKVDLTDRHYVFYSTFARAK